jgi:predicted dehydrogenase
MGWGRLQLEAFRRVREFQVVALCDVEHARAQDIAREHKIEHVLADYRDLVARADVDLVSIAAPPDLHKPIAHAAIQAGKHVLVEKPLALNASDAGELLTAAEGAGIVHAVDFEMRFLPALAYGKELIEEEYLGQLLRVDVTMSTERPWGEHGNWAADDARGGGVLMELGSHFIDLLLWWFGAARAALAGRRTHFPTVKTATPSQSLHPTGGGRVTGDDAFWSVLQFERGGEALLNFVTGARRDAGWSICAYGSLGSLIVQSGQLLGRREGDREIARLPIPKRLELGDHPQDPLMWGMAKLFERVADKINRPRDAKPFPDFRAGVAVARVIDALRRASDEREWVEIT